MLHESSKPAERRARNDENAGQSPDMHREEAVGGGCGCATEESSDGGCGAGIGAATSSALSTLR